ncbi:ROK family transcriptional regulator [Heyndrickxia oleronia]|uniref:ROK family transcriptional regulator n=1 Tax=Heyndrickxia oleronia TaxID=38875 RepID=A0AAW6SY24_9BACI|nr:ROK family transcriptional regulator [Heyndrickxia oleronia]MDH5162218.1 ROK family transcriptional regulator [Heyndrickxia oleronia]
MSQFTWNQQVVKRNNKSIVLQMIIEQEPLSRADIAQRTGLNKATVSSLVNELLLEELIYESGPGESSGGRRPVILHFNKITGYSIGIDIGVNFILGVLTDLEGTIIYEESLFIHDTDFSVVLELVKKMIFSLKEQTPESRYGIIGIGIGVPGIVDKQGTVLLAPNLGWKNVSFKEAFENEFNLPVIVENEANAGAYGEKCFGEGQNSQNMIYVSAGIGIGVGIILNGELYRGKNGYSGEMGHMIIEVNGKPCRCGSNGCWEAYASEYALLNTTNQKDATLESIINLADANDKDAIKLLERIGNYLGYGMNNIINTFNPEMIIIGNRLAKAKKWIEHPIDNTIKNHTLSFQQNDLKLVISNQYKYSTALGMSSFAVEKFIKA